MSGSPDIHIRVEGKAGRITLTRPKALNALTYDMALAIEQALLGWQHDDAVRLVIIDAEGDRAFCAGGDIQDLYETGKAGNFDYGRTFWADEYRLNALIADYGKPYVAVMDGIVMGGGVGISAHGSHRIVTENTMLAMPECGIGLVPDVGGSLVLARAPGHLGEYLGTTGARIRAADAILTGFADIHVLADQLETLVAALCETGDPAQINKVVSDPQPGELEAHKARIDACFGRRTALDAVRALEADGSEWALAQAKLMRRGCPLSVACAHAMIINARQYGTMVEALEQEYRFTYRSMSNGEFVEGVRAQIIDKDRSPKWQTASLEEVTGERIQAMLADLGDDELRNRWVRENRI